MLFIQSLQVFSHRFRPAAGLNGNGFVRAIATLCALVSVGSVLTLAAEPVRLPQDHPYQVILRDYLAKFREADFAVPLVPVEFREQWFRKDEPTHRMWVLAQSFPDVRGLTIAADNFLLRSIESPEGIRMRAGGRGGLHIPGVAVHPDDTVWWSTWEYRGNPYQNSRAVRNRAFVVAAVDMIMLDRLHESGKDWVKNARRSDFLGGTLAWLVHVYRDVRTDLPADVRQAYETGIAKFLDRLTEWGPTAVCDNMDMKALVAAAYTAATFRDGPLVDKARAYAARVLELIHPAGIVRDCGGVEASYNGIASFSAAWAAAVMPWPELLEAERRMSDLKGHLTLPEPDGLNFWGPSHFSTRTSADSASDQWGFPHRDISMAMRASDAVYLMFTGRPGRDPCWAVPDWNVMVSGIRAAVDRLNGSLKASNERFTTWEAGWWASGKFNFAYDHYRPGFYDELRRFHREGNPVILPPIVRPGDSFIRAYPAPDVAVTSARDRDTFLIARFPDYAAILYTGRIGDHPYMNLAGGGLSAFWTPAGGSVVLGRTGKPVEPDKSRQSWADWRVWPTHALSGQTPSGDAFSSARVRRNVADVQYKVHGQAATVTFSGPIGKDHDKSRAAQNGCIVGNVRYRRTMSVGPRGVVVETRIDSDGKDQVTDLCEIIPLPLHDGRSQVPTPVRPNLVVHHRVAFRVGDELVSPGDGFVDGVTAVEVERFFGGATIRFEQPQRVCLGEVWTDTYQSAMSLRNVLVDVLGKRSGPVALPSVTIRYRVEPLIRPVPR